MASLTLLSKSQSLLFQYSFHHYWFSCAHILLITEELDLYENDLNGTILTELGLLSSLVVLDLSPNQLTGTVPTSLVSLSLLSKSQ
jgi:hypothetical protein